MVRRVIGTRFHLLGCCFGSNIEDTSVTDFWGFHDSRIVLSLDAYGKYAAGLNWLCSPALISRLSVLGPSAFIHECAVRFPKTTTARARWTQCSAISPAVLWALMSAFTSSCMCVSI